MGGGYIQLSAIGEQNAYLTGNPQITFFKAVYRRHTNFSIDLCSQNINGTASFGEKFNVIISKYGDLLSNIYVDNLLTLKTTVPINNSTDYITWTNGIGYAILDEYSINIGQNLIDTQNGEWLDIYNKLSENTDNNNAAYSYRQLVNNSNEIVTLDENILHHGNLNALSGAITSSIPAGHDQITTRSITELKFWFCKNYGLAIPLISLNNLNVTINFTYKKLSQLINALGDEVKLDYSKSNTSGTHVNTTVWAEYVF